MLSAPTLSVPTRPKDVQKNIGGYINTHCSISTPMVDFVSTHPFQILKTLNMFLHNEKARSQGRPAWHPRSIFYDGITLSSCCWFKSNSFLVDNVGSPGVCGACCPVYAACHRVSRDNQDNTNKCLALRTPR